MIHPLRGKGGVDLEGVVILLHAAPVLLPCCQVHLALPALTSTYSNGAAQFQVGQCLPRCLATPLASVNAPHVRPPVSYDPTRSLVGH